MAILEPIRGGYYLWKYIPSLAAAIIFILVFLVMTALISQRMFRTKTWFCVPFAIGGLFEFAGYCARVSAHSKTGKIIPYAVQNVFILLGPALFAVSIYMCLSRIIRGIRADHHSLIQPRKLTRTFVTGDVLSFVVQGGAAGLMVTGKNAKIGEGIVVAGLLVQTIMFGLFAVTAVVFNRRIRHSPTTESSSSSVPWQKSMRMLYIVSALIMARSLFRVVEYAMGNDGYPLMNEWTLYIFDSVPMFAVMVVYYLWYPFWIAPQKLEVAIPLV
ncbi:RTA1 like protein [Lentithecium fluviatile CBS 122367]|uniref:RTA1 like protein n=1 Tax=Lentithecium fluviatile CBS 122367 TaxID=1168545 RepID=A0A6G1ICL1_9PLEO|nr:RTA1 like protein [Lentithecium fluviatile CBS 122367]